MIYCCKRGSLEPLFLSPMVQHLILQINATLILNGIDSLSLIWCSGLKEPSKGLWLLLKAQVVFNEG